MPTPPVGSISTDGGHSVTRANDTYEGSSRVDFMIDNSDDKTIKAEGGNDWVYGGEGVDTIYGGAGNDIISGDEGDDTIYGGAGRDTLSGDEGDDTIYGDGGNDSLFGDEGDDELYGGGGNDTLTGGSGEDKFVFQSGHGNDKIQDFENGTDKIDLSAFSSITAFTNLNGKITEDGDDTKIDLSDFGGGEIVLEDFTSSNLDATDFDFT